MAKPWRVFVGGDEEDRTLDLTDANRTLSQLSYAPNSSAISVQLRSRNLLYHRIFHMSIQNLHNLINEDCNINCERKTRQKARPFAIFI